MSLNMLNIFLWPLFVVFGLALVAVIGATVGVYRGATHKRRSNRKLLKSLDGGKREVNLAELKRTNKNEKNDEEVNEQVVVNDNLEERKKNLENEETQVVNLDEDLEDVVLKSNFTINKKEEKKEEVTFNQINESSNSNIACYLDDSDENNFTK